MTKNAPTPVGSAFLTKQNNLDSGGWASLSGQEPFKFTQLETLRQLGPIWVVSTPEKSFLTEQSADLTFLRHASFLPTPITAIAEEMVSGGASIASASSAARVTSEIYTRVLAMADKLAPVSSLLVGKKASANIRTLTSAIQSLMAPPQRLDEIPKDLSEALPSLFISPGPLGTSNSKDVAIRIPVNRIVHAFNVLDTPVPGAQWRQVGLNEYPNALSWAVGEGQPIIAKVSVKGPLQGVRNNAPLMARLTTGAVRWMALPEIMALSNIVEMKAEQVFVAMDLVPASASLKVPPPTFTPTATASISCGLFAEAYMAAVTQPSIHKSPDANDASIVQRYPMRAAWLASVARATVLREALTLSSMGFSVVGFGQSHVLVSVSMKNLSTLRRAVSESRLLSYPAGLRAQEPELQVPSESHQISEEIR